MKTLILFILASVCTTVLAQTRRCPSEGDLQLVETVSIQSASLNNAGRLEVCNADGFWSTVAFNTFTESNRFWSDKNVQVACVQMGYSGGLNSVPPDQLTSFETLRDGTPVSYASVQCDGTESNLTSCPHSVLMGDEFDHSNDVFIVCRPRFGRYTEIHPPGVQVGDVRLVGDVENGQGAVEIYTTEFGWTGICPDGSWDDSDAGVICEILGYETGSIENYDLSAGAIDQRKLADAQCSQYPDNDFTRLQAGNCSFLQASDSCSNMFNPNVFAGVICRTSSTEESIRLVGQRVLELQSDAGVIEILYNNRWGVLCEPPPEQLNRIINLFCRTLGFDGGMSVRSFKLSSLQAVESNLKPLWWGGGAFCREGGSAISDCSSQPIGYGDCPSGNIIVAECTRGGVNIAAAVGGLIAAIVIFIILAVLTRWRWVHGPGNRHREWRMPRTQARAEVPATTSRTLSVNRPSNRRSDEVTHEETQLKDPELSKIAPPSYKEASDLPALVPQDERPPPYVPATNGASAAYPPATTSGTAYPPTATATLYPPVQTNDPAYPSNASAPTSGAAYPPTATATLYPPVQNNDPSTSSVSNNYQAGTGSGLPYPPDSR